MDNQIAYLLKVYAYLAELNALYSKLNIEREQHEAEIHKYINFTDDDISSSRRNCPPRMLVIGDCGITWYELALAYIFTVYGLHRLCTASVGIP